MESFSYNMYLKKINTTLEKIVNSYLHELGLTVSQWKYLNYLYSRGGEHVYLKDIEHYFEVSQPTVVGILKRLRVKGLLNVEKADYSPNSKAVTLTEMGIQVCEYGLEKKKFMDELLLKPLDEDERVVFKRSLEKIYDSLKDIQ